MNVYLCTHPRVLSLLQDARQHPEQDGPRLVLADWLEEHGDPDRAEFLRVQCQLATGGPALEPAHREDLQMRVGRLLESRGGCWLGPLWRWPARCSWHRGLLAFRLPRRFSPEGAQEVLPWLDSALFCIGGWQALRQALALLAACGVNHAHLDLRQPLPQARLLAELSVLGPSPCLRSLSFGWPGRMLRRVGGGCEPALDEGFLPTLLALPLGRCLTHLGSSWPFSEAQGRLIRQRGVEPVHADHPLWVRQRHPSCFRPRCPAPGRQVEARGSVPAGAPAGLKRSHLFG